MNTSMLSRKSANMQPVVEQLKPLPAAKEAEGRAPEFQAEGNIVYLAERRHASGIEQIKHSRHFVVARKESQWKIRTTNLNEDNVVNGIEYDETGCEGTKIFELKQFDEDKLPRASDSKNRTTAHGRVRYGSAPVGFDVDLMYPLWIAYCSSNYFLTCQDNRMTPPLFVMPNSLGLDVPPTLSLPAEWKLNESDFVTEIAWHSEGKELGLEGERTHQLHALPPPFDKGFLRATFKTTEWTGFSGMRLPARFAVKVFFPNWTTGELEVSYAIEAKLRTVQQLRIFSFLPELTRKTSITDTRYRVGGSPGCLLSYGGITWMTEEEVEAKCKSLGMDFERQLP